MIAGQSLRFDQRPGELEAARIAPASGIVVTGSRGNARPSGGATASGCLSAASNWAVLCTVRGEDGSFCQAALTPAAARQLAGELVDLADVLEGHIW